MLNVRVVRVRACRLERVRCRVEQPPKIATVRGMLFDATFVPVRDGAAQLGSAEAARPENIKQDICAALNSSKSTARRSPA